LSKEYREENTGRPLSFSLSLEERKVAESSPAEVVPTYYSLKCYMGVWDEGISSSSHERDSILNHISREGVCFFFPYHPAMLFDAARELQRRASDNQQMKRSNLYTRIGLWVAAGALAVSALVEYLKNV
jgi:hypothetical protein